MLKLEVKILRNLYFFLFFLGVGLVILMHTFERPALDLFRVPTFIEAASKVNGLEYFTTFKIYQTTLVFSLFSILVDALCLTRYKSRALLFISEVSSIFGAILMLAALFYFGYNFFIVHTALKATTIVYIAFSFLLVILDLFTFSVDRNLETVKNV